MRAVSTRREVKEERGKVFAVELDVDRECRVLRLGISGDFFAYPPETVDYLERVAVGRHASELVELAPRILSSLVLIGVSREAAVSLFKSVVDEVLAKCRGSSS